MIRGPGDQGGGSHSSLLTSDWLCEGRAGEPRPGYAGEAMRGVLGGWPRLPAPCYFDRVGRADESGQSCEGEALGEELWYSGVSTKTTNSEKTRLWGGRSGGKEDQRWGGMAVGEGETQQRDAAGPGKQVATLQTSLVFVDSQEK